MTSFVDMMANDVWSEEDIVNRTEAMIASEFPPAQVAILNRVATAAALGQYTLTDDEVAEIERYNVVCVAAREAGIAARADMQQLQRALDYEAAQSVIDASTTEVRQLVADRLEHRTPVDPDPIEQPQE